MIMNEWVFIKDSTEQINMYISVSQHHFCLFPVSVSVPFCSENRFRVRSSLEIFTEGLLKDVVPTSIVPVHLTLLMFSLYRAKHIMFYVELS